jgi:hypothetical protein
MGFRDIELFNLALLAKQAWRLLQEPNSLSARILKAVYFPNGDFLEAELGSSPSRIWRSIMDGREVLKQGLIKRIGTGEETLIWDTNWLPRDGLLRPLSCMLDSTVHEPPTLVSELIDDMSMTWDQELLGTVFLPMDAELIANIPLSTRRQSDFWAWHYERNGLFSVRSAYRMLINTSEQRSAWLEDRSGSSRVSEEEKGWSMLWKVKVPSKIKVFLWRLARQSLPTADVAHHRHMAPHSLCAVCGEQDSWRHSLLDFLQARSVWALAPEEVGELIANLHEPHARGWLFAVLKDLPREASIRVVVTLWALWHAKRKIIHEGQFQSPLSTHHFIERFLSELGQLAPVPLSKPASAAPGPRWIALLDVYLYMCIFPTC